MDMTENPNYYLVKGSYKSKYICTDCRKVFKRKVLTDITLEKDLLEKEPKCPDCRKPTSWIGPKFRAPKTDNIKAWNSIRTLNDIGVLNFIGFANDKVSIPETKKSLNDLLIELKVNCELSMSKWLTNDYSPENKNQVGYLSEMIKRIDNHLKNK